jgi:host factor-I protein
VAVAATGQGRDPRPHRSDRRVYNAGRAGPQGSAAQRTVQRLRLVLKKVPEDPKNRQFLQLNRYRRERTPVHVYLLSGTRFTGRIRSFDVHTLLLETQHGEMVVYGHAISTIEPAATQRGRRPGPGPGRRGDSDAPRRDAGWAGREAPEPADEDAIPDITLPTAPMRPAPAAPTVTIVRRRSRLLPKD